MTGESKFAVKQLKESEEKYRRMIELANDAIFSIETEQATIVEVNPKAEELSGYSADELIGMKVWELHPPEEVDAAKELFASVLREGQGYRTDLHLRRKDGLQRLVEVSAAVIRYGDKKLIQRICRDVTERWELQQENAYLKQYYESILDMMPVGLGVRRDINKTPTLEYENKQLKEMFNLERSRGCQCGWHQLDTSTEVSTTATVNPNGVYAEERLLPGGHVYQFTITYFRDRHNAWRELQIVQDVTERRRLEDQLRQAKAGLERKVEERTRELKEKQAQLVQAEKMASLGNLVAGVAHEINTPLGALKSNFDLFVRSLKKTRDALAGLSATSEFRETKDLAELLANLSNLTIINQTATERIVTIVNSLRRFARLDQGEKDFFDLHEGIENTLTLVNHELKNRIEVVREYGDIPEISCFPNQLNQVFMNILVNASHAIADRGTIRIRTYRRGGDVVVEFIDSGKGIPERQLAKIFDPGFTTKGFGIGTGLGLSIVHQIIKDHGGSIEVESETERGTTFRLILPVEKR